MKSIGIIDLMKPTNGLPACDSKIYNEGEQVSVVSGGSAQLINRFVKELAEFSGEPVDWHYVGGRGRILTTGNVKKVQEAIRQLRLHFLT